MMKCNAVIVTGGAPGGETVEVGGAGVTSIEVELGPVCVVVVEHEDGTKNNIVTGPSNLYVFDLELPDAVAAAAELTPEAAFAQGVEAASNQAKQQALQDSFNAGYASAVTPGDEAP